jgi:uncharacterized protein (DUF433 family)
VPSSDPLVAEGGHPLACASFAPEVLARLGSHDAASRPEICLTCCDMAGTVGAASMSGVTYERITTDPDVMGGTPCIRGLRFPVTSVVAMVADSMSTEEILADHPDLIREDIHESLFFAAEAVREREIPLRHTA